MKKIAQDVLAACQEFLAGELTTEERLQTRTYLRMKPTRRAPKARRIVRGGARRARKRTSRAARPP
jgi:hypothetical protein